ncbi:MAG: hypothetical protein COA57_00980 [Flavobacteriales bacterium]|nr:MAG: hypothetical protein COA57_00980 [Flavobacteriales bacterium]
MNILVTGATGFLGKYIVRELLDNNHRVFALVRNKAKIPSGWEDIQIIEGSLTDNISGQIQEIDAVIHNAAKTPGADFNTALQDNLKDDFFKTNAEGTQNLIQLCQGLNIHRFIFVSSHVVVEEYRQDYYTCSKRKAETYITKSDLNWTIARPTGIYGANDYWKQQIKKYRKMRFTKIYGNGNETLQYVYVKDVSKAVVNIINNSQTIRKSYILAGPSPFSKNQYYKSINNIVKTNILIVHIPLWLVRLIVIICDKLIKGLQIKYKNIINAIIPLSYNIEQAQSDFNFRPRDFEHGLKDLLNDMNEI